MTRGNNRGSNWYALKRQEQNRREHYEEKLAALTIEEKRWPERVVRAGVSAKLSRRFGFYGMR